MNYLIIIFIELKVPTKRIRYAFLLVDYEGKSLVYYSKGFSEVSKALESNNLNFFFNYPYMHEEDLK